jgi:glycosyltransferase involved in cell wall biosynthesis
MMTDPIAIDARAAARPELGGVERWARELVARLPALRPEGYVVLRPPPAFTHAAGHAWEQVVLPVRAARMRALLCPANLAPLAYPRSVVVVHDAAALRHPGWYSRAYVAWQRLMLPAIARRAWRLITVSEFSRGELTELLGVDPERVTVIPGGVGERFTPAAEPAPSLPRPYVLCVASHTARKNLAALVPAARALASEGIDVVVAGGHRPQFAREQGLEALRLLGHVDDALLPGLYAGAAAFALPSSYEGFGLPVLEAMAAGGGHHRGRAPGDLRRRRRPRRAGGVRGRAGRAAGRHRGAGAAARGRPRACRRLHLGRHRACRRRAAQRLSRAAILRNVASAGALTTTPLRSRRRPE